MKISRTAFSTAQAYIPVCFVGDNGIGKTTTIKRFAEFLNRECVHLPLIGADPPDLLGYPKIKEDGKNEFVRNVPIEDFIKIRDKDRYVLLLDEISRADEKLQNSIAQVLDRDYGQFKLPNEVIVFCTSNVVDIGGLSELNYNILTRLAWYECDIDSSEEFHAIVTGKYNTDAQFKKLPSDWRKFEGVIRSKFAGFHKVRPTAFKDTPSNNPNKIVNTTWCNPRTLHRFCIPACAAAFACGYNKAEDLHDVIKACVGPKFASEFIQWIVNSDLIPVDEFVEKHLLKNTNYSFRDAGVLLLMFSEVLNKIYELGESKESHGIAARLWRISIGWLDKFVFSKGTYKEVATYIISMMLDMSSKYDSATNRIVGPVPPSIATELGLLLKK